MQLAPYFQAGLLSCNLLVSLIIWQRIKLFNRRNTIILAGILLICYLIGVTNHVLFINDFLYPFMVIQFVMMVRRVNNWLLPALFFTIQLCLTMVVWIITFDLPRMLTDAFFKNVNQPLVILLLFLSQNTLILVVYWFLKKMNDRTHFWNFLYERPKKNRLLSIVILFIILSLAVIHGHFAWTQNWLFGMYTAFILGSVCLLLALVVHNSIDNQKKLNELRTLTEIYSVEVSKNELTSEFQHDFKALLISLNSCLKENAIDDAKRLLSQVIVDSKEIFQTNSYAGINRLNNVPLQGLLLNFLKDCEESGISTEVTLVPVPIALQVEVIDLVRGLSILLNNAYENTVILPPHLHMVTIVMKDSGEGQLSIIITNPIEKKIEIEQILKKGYSTKEGHKGIGLNYLKRITSDDSHLHLYLRQTKRAFFAELIVDYIKNREPTS